MRPMGVWIRLAVLTAIVSVITLPVALLSARGVSSTSERIAFTGSLQDDPLVVTAAGPILAGQQAAAEAARRAAPDAVLARERSQTAYTHLAPAKIPGLLRQSFPAVIAERSGGKPALPRGARIVSYPTAHAVQIALPGHRRGVMESLYPVATRSSDGGFKPIDLTLKSTTAGYVPATPVVPVVIPQDLSTGVQISGNGVALTPVDEHGNPLSGHGTVDGASVVYPATASATDTIAKPTPRGFQLDAALRSSESPQKLYFRIDGPQGSKLIENSGSGTIQVVSGGDTIATVAPPSAQDSAETNVPASMHLDGHTLVVDVAHRSGSYLYPIEVDPEVLDKQLAVVGSKRSNWVVYSNKSASFSSRAVYEAENKEFLETKGVAAYSEADHIFWAYETKGNSKIYEVKTTTSGKNTGDKIESFLKLEYSETNNPEVGVEESKVTLSTEFTEPEYSNKTNVICPPHSGEGCASTLGHEKNAILFEQAATKSTTTNFAFSDTMSEAVVQISEPSGTHSATSYNTTSSEIEYEEAGKKEKQPNVLYNTARWLSPGKGVIQANASDPGIGVATTKLEYEGTPGVWTQLFKHEYLKENLCGGVQCYASHSEYVTYNSNLPDGERKIRYRAEEAIEGTTSLETEGKATVKVDGAKPQNLELKGIPWGEELSQRPYEITGEATDGEGTTVASSGIQWIKLYIDGGQFGVTGPSCSVAKGACTAKQKWTINGAELGAGNHAIVLKAMDNAGNEATEEWTLSVNHSTPVALGPGSVDLQSGDFALQSTDVSMGSGLGVTRTYSSRDVARGPQGSLGPEWDVSLSAAESLTEMVDGGVLLTDAKHGQSIFAPVGGGKFESPVGDANLELSLEENKETKQKLAYHLKNTAKGTSVKFTQVAPGTTWLPTEQEGTTATDTVTYKYEAVHKYQEYAQIAGSNPFGLAGSADGHIWFVETGAPKKVVKLTTAGVATEYTVPNVEFMGSITEGPDGNMWFRVSNSKIARVTSSGQVTEYAVNTSPSGIASGTDGNVWFVGNGKIGKITMSGTVTEYTAPSPESRLQKIVAGPDGKMWFTNEGATSIAKHGIGVITTSGQITEYSTSSIPEGITAGTEGNLWFTTLGTPGKIGKITTTGAITEYTLSSEIGQSEIIEGPDGNFWYTNLNNAKIGKISTSGVATEYALSSEAAPRDITLGPDGNIWFTDENHSVIGTMTTDGVMVRPTEALAPKPAGVSCTPLKAGCRALKFKYASGTTATGESLSEWGTYVDRLSQVVMTMYNPSTKVMQETAVAEYSYDKLGRLRAEWDPRISPALKTTYGYDEEGHLTALTPPGQESWAFTYGTIANDKGTGRLLKASRADASEPLWGGSAPASTEAPTISGSAVVGNRMTVSNGKWSNSPVAYSYQWEACNTETGQCVPIAGAHNQNYTPTDGNVGSTLKAVVTATNGGGSVSAANTVLPRVEAPRFTEYALRAEAYPWAMTTGPDGNIWFTEMEGAKVAKIAPIEGVVTEWQLGNLEPESLTAGPDGNVWVATRAGGAIDHITPSGVLTKYILPNQTESALLSGIASGPEGMLWYTAWKTKRVGKITTNDEVKAEYTISGTEKKPFGIAAGPSGENKVWVTDIGSSKIDKVSNTGAITEYALPAGSEPYGITLGSGEMWFTDRGTSKVGRITTAGAVTEYALPAGSAPRGITWSTSASAAFVAEYGTSKIAKVTSTGTITQYSLPTGSQPMGITIDKNNNVWATEKGTSKLVRFNPSTSVEEGAIVPGEAKTPSAGFAMEYGVPLTGGSGLPAMTKEEVAKWGQADKPVEGTAVMPPDARQGWPATDYTRATVYYLDKPGHTVNVSAPTNSNYGSVNTTEFNEDNDVVRTLTPANRQAALEAGGESVNVAKLRATYYTYNEECSKPSENKEETPAKFEGSRLCEVEGPQHTIGYVEGSEHKEALARLHTKFFYDEKAPTGEAHNLKTKETTIAQFANEEEREVRKTVYSYSGQSNLGWKLRAPTSVTIDPEGKKITTTTLYNATTGQVTETRNPKGPSGESPHDGKIIYYSAGENTEGYASCGNHPEWAGLTCETLPAKQPEAGTPALPVTTTTYNVWNEPETITQAFGATTRTKKQTYDGAGRLLTSETTSASGVALPKVTNEYNAQTGALEKASTTVGTTTKTLTSKYNKLGQLAEYSDADGNTAKYVYGGAENDWLIEELSDGSAEGAGRQVYSYNATTKRLEKLWDSAAGTFTASYDVEGKMMSEVYPNAMCANTSYNDVKEATRIEYIKTSNCSESGAPVWYSETRTPSVRGETFDRSSTLAGESYFYDTIGRLTEAREVPAGGGCSVRLYAYDEESVRTSQTTRTPGVGGVCATEGGTTLTHTYDNANRLKDSGVTYDVFGNVTKLPAADAEGHELTSTFYVDNAVATQSQNGVTNSYYLDPAGRVRETVTGSTTAITHYDGAGDTVAWTSEGAGKGTRNIPGLDGGLAATQTNGEAPVLQLPDLQGDVIATASLSTEASKLLSTYNSTEFGVPNGSTPPKYAWLGASEVASAFSTGVITYGSTSYVPQIGRPLQSERVAPPGLPEGSGGGAPYVIQLEPWVMQGAAASAAEAPGLEAAREQAAAEEAEEASEEETEEDEGEEQEGEGTGVVGPKNWVLTPGGSGATASGGCSSAICKVKGQGTSKFPKKTLTSTAILCGKFPYCGEGYSGFSKGKLLGLYSWINRKKKKCRWEIMTAYLKCRTVLNLVRQNNKGGKTESALRGGVEEFNNGVKDWMSANALENDAWDMYEFTSELVMMAG
jgi:streptogramin lyase